MEGRWWFLAVPSAKGGAPPHDGGPVPPPSSGPGPLCPAPAPINDGELRSRDVAHYLRSYRTPAPAVRTAMAAIQTLAPSDLLARGLRALCPSRPVPRIPAGKNISLAHKYSDTLRSRHACAFGAWRW